MTGEAYEKKSKTIPLFTSEEVESEFWLSTDTTEYFSDDVEEYFQPPKKIPVSLKIDTRLMMFIKRLAKDKGVSYQTLMCQWLWERVREEATLIRSVHNQ
ncbi:hypothetical protein FJZ31_26745 [Candidatus Poribacteria bacterium]|nr:hypothetical protein [Candidatus Poribacteria bacterium]